MKANKQIKTMVAGALLLTGACIYVGAHAAPMATDLPPTQQQGDVTFLTGGIGEHEADAIKHAEAHYPLTLEFTEQAKPHDEYMADIKVKLTNKSGKVVLSTTASGPFLLAKLPDGLYKVSAEDDKGKTIIRHVDVTSRKPERMVFIWS